MGWSIDVVRPKLETIFKESGRKYRVTRPQSSQQAVVIEYLSTEDGKDVAPRFKMRISELFPDFVYIDFIMVQASQVVADQMEWDN